MDHQSPAVRTTWYDKATILCVHFEKRFCCQHQLTMPYGGIGSGGAAKTTSSNDGGGGGGATVIGGSGSSAFQPKVVELGALAPFFYLCLIAEAG